MSRSSSHLCMKYLFILSLSNSTLGILYPRESETRDIKDISGRWKFRIDDSLSRNQGFQEKWWNTSLADSGFAIDMPVPSSYNDVTQNKTIRDFVGWAWYQTELFVPSSWSQDCLVWIRIGSAHYYAVVWVNSAQVATHEGGHLPFEAEVGSKLVFGVKNTVTIAVNNTLTPTTIPPGIITHKSEEQQYPAGYFVQEYQFDFFNYAGIHRPVKLYTKPTRYAEDIGVSSITCDSTFHQCTIKYEVKVGGQYDSVTKYKKSYATPSQVKVSLLNKKKQIVATSDAPLGQLVVTNPHLWWPVGMNESIGYLYTLTTEVYDDNGMIIDVYRLPFGIRTVRITDTKFLINEKPFYFLGVGKHEDWDIRGKGFDWVSIIKDFNMLDWIGANSFRTSHYPYSEEIMQMCDERGIVVIDECPAVGMHYENNFVDKTMAQHKRAISEMVSRDRNHASVVMWSVANEPKSSLKVSEEYFKNVIEFTKSLDITRPVTFVCNENFNSDLATPFVDVVSVNKYSSWYEDSGHTEVIQGKVGYFLNQWFEKRNKPVIHMEWGAGAIAGMHSDPSVMFTEEYLEDVMQEHFKVFDSLRHDFLVGEMIWNFADFATKQGTTRIVGNKKGILTRQRNPKSAAFVIKKRYHSLRNQTFGFR